MIYSDLRNTDACENLFQSALDPESPQQEGLPHTRHVRAINTSEPQPLDMVAEASDMDEPIADTQHFYPSFSPLFPPLGHSRPPFYQEPVFNARQAYKPHDNFGFGTGNFRDYSFPQATAESERSANVLGSGNFGVIRGGTYYPGENDEVLNEDIYNNYYNNGHGRPSYYPANPLPAFRNGGDFFANFKDFAEISTPTKSSYSEFYVVYVNPNSTHHEESDLRPNGSAPKNIFEQLQILDAADKTTKKLSKTKLKLEKYTTHHQNKEVTKKQKVLASPKELYEPLLALSWTWDIKYSQNSSGRLDDITNWNLLVSCCGEIVPVFKVWTSDFDKEFPNNKLTRLSGVVNVYH